MNEILTILIAALTIFLSYRALRLRNTSRGTIEEKGWNEEWSKEMTRCLEAGFEGEQVLDNPEPER